MRQKNIRWPAFFIALMISAVYSSQQRPYIYIDLRRGPPVRLAWLEVDCNMLGGGKTGYLK
jgi:hypothetical protein